jgi:predicted signal transduction protein with EAL and GGDEF domain
LRFRLPEAALNRGQPGLREFLYKGCRVHLDLPVVAEGVETEEQLAFLASDNCNEIQGHFVGRPKPIADYAEVVGSAPTSRRPRKAALAAAG